MVGVLVAVLGFQALESEDWIAIAGVTLWVKLLASFALGRQAHGLGPAKQGQSATEPEARARTCLWAQYASRSGWISCRMVVAISSIDLVVVDSQRMPSRRIMASASLTSMRQFSRLA